MKWFRFYSGAVNDPKVQRLPPEMFRAWVNLLCIASEHDGVLPSAADLAFILRLSGGKVAERIKYLTECGLLDETETGVEPHNWEGRQFKNDVSTERVKRFRKRSETVSETPDETPPEQSRTDTESEQSTPQPPRGEVIKNSKPKKQKAADPHFTALWAAYPKRLGANPRKPAEIKFNTLVAQGVPPETILAGVRALAAEAKADGSIGTKFVPQAITWLNQERWNDHATQTATRTAEQRDALIRSLAS